MSDAPKLLPCPFCGSADLETSHGGRYVVHSNDECEAFRGSMIPVDTWNTRASNAQIMAHPQVKALVDKVAAAIWTEIDADHTWGEALDRASGKVRDEYPQEQHRKATEWARDLARAALAAIKAEAPKATVGEGGLWFLEGLSDGDWPDDFDHENGCYNCNCSTCGKTFTGHKRRVTCKVCARAEGENRNG